VRTVFIYIYIYIYIYICNLNHFLRMAKLTVIKDTYEISILCFSNIVSDINVILSFFQSWNTLKVFQFVMPMYMF
jgi:hypothetical protein